MNRASFRLASVQTLLLAAVIILLAVYLLRLLHQHQQDDWRNDMLANARANAAAIELLADQRQSAILAEDLIDLSIPSGSMLALLGPGGEPIAGNPVRDGDTLADAPDVTLAFGGQAGVQTFLAGPAEREYYAVSVPVDLGADAPGVLVLTVPTNAAPGVWSSLARYVTASLVIAFLLLVVVSARSTRVLTAPIEQLTGVVRRVARGDLQARAESGAYDELDELAAEFNEVTDEMRRQLQALEQERARLESILEHLNDGILIVDPRGAVILMNESAERLLGVDRDRALVRTYAEVVRDHELVELIRHSESLYDPELPLPSRFIELGRPRRAVQAFAYPIFGGDNELVIVILRDITELRRTETVRRDFVANVSHDLRTPIASLKALVDTLLGGALEDEEVARDFLSRMEVEVDDLARLVEELLELSRAESRRIELHQLPADVGNLIRRAVSRLQPHAEPKGIEIQLDVQEDLPPGYVDPDRIDQVLVNLLHNAIKFTPEGGTIRLMGHRQNGMVRVAVADSGPGIPPGEIERVFERFYKSDQSRAKTGSGLGLAIAKHLVQLHGGRIWAESEHRGGATFAFTVPVATSEQVQEFRSSSE